MLDTLRRLKTRLSDLALENLPSIRNVLFRFMLVASLGVCVNTLVGPPSHSFTPDALVRARLVVIAWMLVHGVAFFVHRNWPQAAYFAFLILTPITLTFAVEYTPYGPRDIVGALFTYHAALTLLAVVLMSFRYFAPYVTATTLYYIGFCFYMLRDEPPEVAIGFATPLIGHWLLSIVVSWLLDKHNRHIVSRRETLEAELARRTRIIEAQNTRLLQQEKLSAVGRLAGGIAHDFNNIMTVVKINAGRVVSQHETEHPSAASARSIIDAVDRGSELTEQLLGFARKGKHRNVPVDIHGIVDSVIRIIGRTVDRRIDVRRECDASWSVVMGDPSQIHQVIMNLAINAVDAMPTGGELVIRTVDREGDDVPPGTRLSPGRYVCVSVRDTGGGLTDEAMEHLFEPYFTTKNAPGHGMGLAMVYGIVTNHGGWIGARSRPGEHTTFDILLPAVARASRAPEATTSATPSRGKGTVLVVDDEKPILDAVEAVLTDLGYSVLKAADGAKALEAFRASDRDIDLVLLDLTMPVMDGVECFGEMLRIAPSQRTVIATGHTRDGVLEELRRKGAVDVLLKPYDMMKLSECVSSHIGGRAAGRNTA